METTVDWTDPIYSSFFKNSCTLKSERPWDVIGFIAYKQFDPCNYNYLVPMEDTPKNSFDP
jgi:hypothetical protein